MFLNFSVLKFMMFSAEAKADCHALTKWGKRKPIDKVGSFSRGDSAGVIALLQKAMQQPLSLVFFDKCRVLKTNEITHIICKNLDFCSLCFSTHCQILSRSGANQGGEEGTEIPTERQRKTNPP